MLHWRVTWLLLFKIHGTEFGIFLTSATNLHLGSRQSQSMGTLSLSLHSMSTKDGALQIPDDPCERACGAQRCNSCEVRAAKTNSLQHTLSCIASSIFVRNLLIH